MKPIALLALALLPLVGCGNDDDTPAVATTSTTEDGTTTETTSDGDASGDSELADVSVWINDAALGIAAVCQGADGAVVVDTVSGRRVMVIREQGLALRISTDGGDFAESSAVTVVRAGEVQRYEAEVLADDEATEVRVEMRDDLESGLDVCPELGP